MMPPEILAHVWTEPGIPELSPIEAAGIRRAVEKRRAEFARGRGCARRVLEGLGHTNVVVPMGPGREPVWPAGVVASITHTEGFVAAAGADVRSVAALGVDVERIRALDPGVASLVLTPEEARRDSAPEWGVLAFSAKESVHKTVHPATGERLDFLDVSIIIDGTDSFRVVGESEKGRSLELLNQLHGVFRVVPPYVMTLVYARP